MIVIIVFSHYAQELHQGSPGWTTKKAPQRVLQGFFLCQALFLYPFHLPRVLAAVGVGVCPDEPFIVQPFNIEGKPAAGVGKSFLLYQVGIIDGPLVGGFVLWYHVETFGMFAKEELAFLHAPLSLAIIHEIELVGLRFCSLGSPTFRLSDFGRECVVLQGGVGKSAVGIEVQGAGLVAVDGSVAVRSSIVPRVSVLIVSGNMLLLGCLYLAVRSHGQNSQQGDEQDSSHRWLFSSCAGTAVFGALFRAVLEFHLTEAECDACGDVAAVKGVVAALAEQVGVGVV